MNARWGWNFVRLWEGREWEERGWVWGRGEGSHKEAVGAHDVSHNHCFHDLSWVTLRPSLPGPHGSCLGWGVSKSLRLWCDVPKERILLNLEPQIPLKTGGFKQETHYPSRNCMITSSTLVAVAPTWGGPDSFGPGHLSQTSQWRLWSNTTQFDLIISSILQHKRIPCCVLVTVCL